MTGTIGAEAPDKIKADDALKHIPIIFIASSNANQRMQTSYDLHANGYVAKPIALRKYYGVVANVESVCLDIAISPDK